MKQFLLFTPGPVNVAANVRLAICKNDICHRESEFDELLASIEQKLLSLFQINDKARYRAVVITGSGTAANEAILSSVVGDKHVLIVSNGEFGDRLHATSCIHNKNTSLLEFPWGQSIDLDLLASHLQRHKVDIVMMAHHETCSGMLNPLQAIGSLAKANGALFMVDCVSSAGAEPIDMEGCNIAFCSSSSSKAIGSYAGLSFVIGETAQFERLKFNPVKSTYLNLATFYAAMSSRSQTPNTPGVPLFYALEQALSNILQEGVANRHAKLKKRANMLRRGMLKLGLKFLIERKDMCSVLTTVVLPPNFDAGRLRQQLRDREIIIYEGKGCFRNKVFQVGNIGELSSKDIRFFLSSLAEILPPLKPALPDHLVPASASSRFGVPVMSAAGLPITAGT